MTLPLTPANIAHMLGGDVVGRSQVLAPGPGHSPRDRSLSIRLDDHAPDGFLVHSHAGDDPLAAKDYVRQRLGLPVGIAARSQPDAARIAPRSLPDDDEIQRTARARAIWAETLDPAGTPVETYLRLRGLPLPPAAVRWHPRCPFGKAKAGCMVALVRDIATNEPRAIHRTAISTDGRKIEIDGNDRLTFGPIAGGAIKLTPDEDVTLSLAIGEGIETVMSLRRLAGLENLSVWSLIAANQVAAFPVLSGIESLWLAVDLDDTGIAAAATVTDRWHQAGREVVQVRPIRRGNDVNDLLKEPSNAA